MNPLDSIDCAIDLRDPRFNHLVIQRLHATSTLILKALMTTLVLEFHEVIDHYKVNQMEHDMAL